MSYCLPEAFTSKVTRARDDLDAPFWAGAVHEDLLIQRCLSCHEFQWLPELMCHHCHADELEFAPVAPRGTIYSWERAWHPVDGDLDDTVPYLVVAVELESCPGIYMIGNLIGDPRQEVVIGTRVSVAFEHHAEYTLVQWRSSQ